MHNVMSIKELFNFVTDPLITGMPASANQASVQGSAPAGGQWAKSRGRHFGEAVSGRE